MSKGLKHFNAHFDIHMYHLKVICEVCSISVERALAWRSKGCWFEPHHQQSHCIVSLSKTLYPLYSTG